MEKPLITYGLNILCLMNHSDEFWTTFALKKSNALNLNAYNARGISNSVSDGLQD